MQFGGKLIIDTQWQYDNYKYNSGRVKLELVANYWRIFCFMKRSLGKIRDKWNFNSFQCIQYESGPLLYQKLKHLLENWLTRFAQYFLTIQHGLFISFIQLKSMQSSEGCNRDKFGIIWELFLSHSQGEGNDSRRCYAINVISKLHEQRCFSQPQSVSFFCLCEKPRVNISKWCCTLHPLIRSRCQLWQSCQE